MPEETTKIPVPDRGEVTAVRTAPETSPNGWLFIYAPGAGSNVHDPFSARACHSLAARGFDAVRFQFPYMEAGKRRPDRPQVLETTWRAVIESVRQDGVRLAMGGRSMGGRIASQVVADGTPADALALFAYPLRPPSNPEKIRDQHLPLIDVPTLFCSGTRDSFGTPDELRVAASKVPRATLHLLEGADHGFSVPKSSGRTREQVWDEAIQAMLDHLAGLG
jgi:predicted alpha/beta-hydrolase family hydrolase